MATIPGIENKEDLQHNGDGSIIYELIAGENTELSADKTTLTASANGYPAISEKKDDEKILVEIAIVPLLNISSDKMFATITLQPGVTGENDLKSTDVKNILAEEGVVYGIDDKIIEGNVERLQSEGGVLREIIVARGILPLHGKNARFRFKLEVGLVAGTLLRNGQIDFCQ